MNNPIKNIENVISDICHDTYILTRDDIDSIEWRLREVQQYIKDAYKKRGKEFI